MYHIKQIVPQYLVNIRLLEKRLYSSPQYVFDNDEYYHKHIFNNGGVLFGAFYNKTLVGAAASTILASLTNYVDYFKTAYRVSANITLDPNITVFFNNTIVDADHRGNQLQLRMREITVEYYRKYRTTKFITTTHIDNIASQTSLVRLGMINVGKGIPPYSNEERYLFYKDSAR